VVQTIRSRHFKSTIGVSCRLAASTAVTPVRMCSSSGVTGWRRRTPLCATASQQRALQSTSAQTMGCSVSRWRTSPVTALCGLSNRRAPLPTCSRRRGMPTSCTTWSSAGKPLNPIRLYPKPQLVVCFCHLRNGNIIRMSETLYPK